MKYMIQTLNTSFFDSLQFSHSEHLYMYLFIKDSHPSRSSFCLSLLMFEPPGLNQSDVGLTPSLQFVL